jgi:hypothetical protein
MLQEKGVSEGDGQKSIHSNHNERPSHFLDPRIRITNESIILFLSIEARLKNKSIGTKLLRSILRGWSSESAGSTRLQMRGTHLQ